MEALEDGTRFHGAARQDLHIRLKVKTNEDCVINLAF
jgi:hypothetical protein